MKAIVISFLFIILFNLSYQLKAQGEAAIPMITLNPSPELNGLGLTGVSFSNSNALDFYYNPAVLGHFSQTNNISIQFYPNIVRWNAIPALNFLKENNFGINIGYNFKNILNGINLSAGVGFIHSRFEYGTFITQSLGSFTSYDEYFAYGLGASIDYYITLSLGLSLKHINSVLAENISADINAIDYGMLITVPVIKLIDENFSFKLSGASKLIPVFNYNLGYSRLNNGGEIYYIDPAQKDPLPLTARLGHTFNLGFDFESDDISINLIDYNLILEADDILIGNKSLNNGIEYQGLLGDINFWKNLIKLKADDKIVVHKGNELSFGETVTLLEGSYYGRSYYNVKTNGLTFSSRGLSKWLGSISNNETLKFIAEHIVLKYTAASIFNGTSLKTEFKDISFSFMNFTF